jgi:hypothetical protein
MTVLNLALSPSFSPFVPLCTPSGPFICLIWVWFSGRHVVLYKLVPFSFSFWAFNQLKWGSLNDFMSIKNTHRELNRVCRKIKIFLSLLPATKWSVIKLSITRAVYPCLYVFWIKISMIIIYVLQQFFFARVKHQLICA